MGEATTHPRQLVVARKPARRLPIITTRVGAVDEIVVDGTGLLVSPGDVGALHDALRRILADVELRTRSGEAARARVMAHYRADRNANRMLDVPVATAMRSANGSAGPPYPA